MTQKVNKAAPTRQALLEAIETDGLLKGSYELVRNSCQRNQYILKANEKRVNWRTCRKYQCPMK